MGDQKRKENYPFKRTKNFYQSVLLESGIRAIRDFDEEADNVLSEIRLSVPLL